MLKRKWSLIGLLAALVLLSGIALMAFQAAPAGPVEPLPSSASYRIDWDVSADGGITMASSQYRMLSTMGQTTVGQNTSTGFKLISGYWAGAKRILSIFLPIINK